MGKIWGYLLCISGGLGIVYSLYIGILHLHNSEKRIKELGDGKTESSDQLIAGLIFCIACCAFGVWTIQDADAKEEVAKQRVDKMLEEKYGSKQNTSQDDGSRILRMQQEQERMRETKKQQQMQARQQREEEKRRQANETKQQATDVALTFTSALFNEEWDAMQGITYCSDKQYDVTMHIAAMRLSRSRMVGYLRYKMNRQGIKNFNYEWKISITDIIGQKAWFLFTLSVDGNVYMTVKDIEMARDNEGQWYVDVASFNNQSGHTMDLLDQRRLFE